MTSTFGPIEARLVLDHVAFPALRFEHGVTRRVIAAIPPARMDYRPAAGARSAGELDSARLGAAGAAARRLYENRFPSVLERLAALEGEHLLRPLDYKGFMRLPALGFVQFALNHTIHHRGQLSVYLRALGVTVPSIYG